MICPGKVLEAPSQPPQASSPAGMEALGEGRLTHREPFAGAELGLLFFFPLYLNNPPPRLGNAANKRAPEKMPSFTYLFLNLLKDT